MKLFVLSRGEVGDEVAVFAETPHEAITKLAVGPWGDVPDEWYDSDVEVGNVKIGKYTIYGPYEQEQR